MNSTRLPGKVLKEIAQKPLLRHIFDRTDQLPSGIRFIVATSDHTHDDVVENFCRINSVACFRGDEQDVLDRYYQCSRKYGFDHIVRLTGDNPLVDIDEVIRLTALHLEKTSDYAHSFEALPVGVGAEIFSFKALEYSYKEGHQPNHREHVNEYIQEHPESHHIENLLAPASKHRPDIRLTVDTEIDYIKVCYIFGNSPSKLVSTEEAIFLSEQYDNLSCDEK